MSEKLGSKALSVIGMLRAELGCVKRLTPAIANEIHLAVEDIARMRAALEAPHGAVEALEKAVKPFVMLADQSERLKDGESVLVNISRCRDLRDALSQLKGPGHE